MVWLAMGILVGCIQNFHHQLRKVYGEFGSMAVIQPPKDFPCLLITGIHILWNWYKKLRSRLDIFQNIRMSEKRPTKFFLCSQHSPVWAAGQMPSNNNLLNAQMSTTEQRVQKIQIRTECRMQIIHTCKQWMAKVKRYKNMIWGTSLVYRTDGSNRLTMCNYSSVDLRSRWNCSRVISCESADA